MKHNNQKGYCSLRTLITLIMVFLYFPHMRAADSPPGLINYQGYLVDDSNPPVPLGNDNPVIKQVKFAIYDTQSGTVRKWEETQSVTFDKGYFNVFLGDGTKSSGYNDLGPDTFTGNDSDKRYVGVTVDLNTAGFDDDQEVAPRLRLLSSPYSFFSDRSKTAEKLVHRNNDGTSSNVLDVIDTAGTKKTKITDNLEVTGIADITGTVTASEFIGNGIVPVGGIIIWSGTSDQLPSNWKICDGSNGTPDLRGRFVIGTSANYNKDAKGGSSTVTLSVNHMPAHTHSVALDGGGKHKHNGTTDKAGSHNHGGTTNNDGGHVHKANAWYQFSTYNHGRSKAIHPHNSIWESTIYSGGSEHKHKFTTGTQAAHTHTFNTAETADHKHTASAGSTGGGGAFNIMPPYYSLAYIMRES